METLFNIFDEGGQRQTQLQCSTPNFLKVDSSCLHGKLRSKSDSCTPFGKQLLSDVGAKTPSFEECLYSGKMISKSPVETPRRTPFQLLKQHSLSRKLELETHNKLMKPFKRYESDSIFCGIENEDGDRTPSRMKSSTTNKTTSRSPLRAPCTAFQTPKTNSQLRGQRAVKGKLKKPHNLIRPFKIFEDSESENIFLGSVKGVPSSKFEIRANCRPLSSNLNLKENHVNGIRPRKYVICDKEFKIQSPHFSERAQKGNLKSPYMLTKPLKIIKDPELEFLFQDNVNAKNTWDRNCLNEEERGLNGIRCKKYVLLDKESKLTQRHAQRALKNIKNFPKWMNSLTTFEDSDSQSNFCNTENAVPPSKVCFEDLPPTETIGEPFWPEDNNTSEWDDMLPSFEEMITSNPAFHAYKPDDISDLPETPKSPLMLITSDGFESISVPRCPPIIITLDSPEEIPFPWEV